MMRPAPFIATAALAASGAVAAPPRAAPATITYETGACFGACPLYSLSLDTRSGQGEFVGRRFTAHQGPQRFRATPPQVAAFRAALAEVRALPGDLTWKTPACKEIATDQDSVVITWRERNRSIKREVYFGCAMDVNRAFYDRIRAAPLTLPVADLIGKR